MAREDGCHDGDRASSALLTPLCPPGWRSCADCGCNQAFIPKGKEIKRERKSAGWSSAAPAPAILMPPTGLGLEVRWWLHPRLVRAQHRAPSLAPSKFSPCQGPRTPARLPGHPERPQ